MTRTMATGVVQCPKCGADSLEVVSDGESTNFLCPGCWTCWHVELGWVQAVDASTCPGCPHRAECLAHRPTAGG